MMILYLLKYLIKIIENLVKGNCIKKNDLRDMLLSDANSERPKYLFSVYKKHSSHLSESDYRRGLGTKPTNEFVFQLNISAITIFVTIGSMRKLFVDNHKTLYAIPLYGGKRRRVGNIEGNLMLVSANHGQIPGFVIYKLYSEDDIRNNTTAEIDDDYELDDFVCLEMDVLLNNMTRKINIQSVIVTNLINYAIGLH